MNHLTTTNSSEDRASSHISLTWLLIGGIGNALAAIVVAGILAGRLGLPIHGALLLGAAGLAILPQLSAIARGRWAGGWPELAAALIAFAAIGGFGLALAWPALLPLGLSVDAVHHTQLLSWVAEHRALPAASHDMQGLLGEMNVYPVGLILVVVAAADLVRQPPLEIMYPTVAILGGLIAGLVVVLASSAGRLSQAPRPNRPFRAAGLSLLALLAGPLLLLLHRTYLLEAYTDHSYYTMTLGVLFVLLAGAWLIVPARPAWAQFGLTLAALVGTYPLWAPLPAALAALMLLNTARVFTTKAPRHQEVKNLVPWCLGGYASLLAFGPALGLALLDLAPRLRGGQTVLIHQGLVAAPTLARLAPVLLALPAAIWLLSRRPGRRLAVFAGLALALALVLALAARFGMAASYHSYKLLFVLLPLAAALIGAASVRLASMNDRGPRTEDRGPRFARSPSVIRPQSPHILGPALAIGYALVLGLTGSFQLVPGQRIQLLDPNIVAAARWLRANQPEQAAQAIAINVPAGPLAYWVQVGLLGQRRDQIEPQIGAIMGARPSVETWLIDRNLPALAIVPALTQPLAGMQVLARFGPAAVVQRADTVDLQALHPLAIQYRAFWEHERLKTAIELQHPLPGPVPLLEVGVYHDGALVNSFALQPEAERTRTQYLGVDLLPQTLGGEGYINAGAHPTFAAPFQAPSGALTLTLRLALGGNTVDERQLATVYRTDDGRFTQIAASSGELIYLRHAGDVGDLRAADLDFGGALRLVGWRGPDRLSAREALAIDLRWQALRPLDRSLFPELQLRNASGQIVATNLAAPQNGFYPTWRWRPGEEVSEQRSLDAPQPLAPGVYRLFVQVHDFNTQRVLGTGQPAEIGAITIDPALAQR